MTLWPKDPRTSEDVRALVRRIIGDVDRVERTADGVSTDVFHIVRGADTMYLRVAEDAGDDMAPEVEAHRRLREAGVRVASIVHYESFAPEIGRSIAITSEIRGDGLGRCTDERVSRSVARAAGRDLAIFNSLEVGGWGWVVRDDASEIRGVYPDRRSWVEAVVEPPGGSYLATVLGTEPLAALETLLRAELEEPGDGPRLAHGDFDVSQIFVADGEYSGIIDLGELMGAEVHYDLAHFLLHDASLNPHRLLPDLIAGYREHTALSEGIEQRMVRTAVLLGVFRMTRVISRWGEAALRNDYVAWMGGRIKAALTEM